MMKRLSLAMSAQNAGAGPGAANSEVNESMAESTATATSVTKSKLSLAGVMLSRRFAKRMSSLRGKGSTHRSSSAGIVPDKEPTYRMEPTHKFNCHSVEKVMQDVLERRLVNVTYEPKKCSMLIRSMSEDIKDRVKYLGFDRYKIVCVMVLCQKHEQAAVCSSRCQWDKAIDNYANYTYKNQHLICNATVYGLYNE